MCISCYRGYGAPVLDTPPIRAAAALVQRVYEFSCAGGNAHVALDDWNLEDSSLDFCLNEALASNVHQAPQEQLDAERAALEAFRSLTLDERAAALGLVDGYFAVDGFTAGRN